MRTTRLICSTAMFALLSMPAFAADSKASETFVKKAAMTDKFEIESSQLALQKSTDPKVKEFAQTMIDDHTKSTSDLKAALGSSEIDPALTDTPLDSKHTALLKKLKSSSGKSFDKQYVNAQKDGHKKAVELFRGYSKNGDDAALKAFAAQTLPVIEGHKDHVARLKAM